jgi:protein TonB
MTAAIPPRFMPYGAPELQGASRPHMVRALMLSSMLGGAVFAFCWALSLTLPTAVYQTPRIPIIDLIPDVPPPIVPRIEEPRIPIARPRTPQAIPVPVPESEAAPPLPSTQGDKSLPGRSREDGLTDGVIVPPTDPGIVNDPGRVAFVDELPEAVYIVKAEYPELAKQAAVEGRVVVDVLVGKDGKVLDARVSPKHSIPMLDPAALAAARQWVFKPALMNNHPVKVWVAVPFHFKLH